MRCKKITINQRTNLNNNLKIDFLIKNEIYRFNNYYILDYMRLMIFSVTLNRERYFYIFKFCHKWKQINKCHINRWKRSLCLLKHNFWRRLKIPTNHECNTFTCSIENEQNALKQKIYAKKTRTISKCAKIHKP